MGGSEELSLVDQRVDGWRQLPCSMPGSGIHFSTGTFVDAPETDSSQQERIVDQAAYFGISPQDIPRAGELAKRLAKSILEKKSITTITRWRSAGGRSALARFYAVILVDDKNLAFELVRHGLARIYGYRANWPDGPRSTTFINQLKNAELQAREQKLGVWNVTQFLPSEDAATAPRTSMATNLPVVQTESPVAPSARIDLNQASREALMRLPAIGPILADRIIAQRPYATVNELRNVRGIGPKTMDRLRSLVTVGLPERP